MGLFSREYAQISADFLSGFSAYICVIGGFVFLQMLADFRKF